MTDTNTVTAQEQHAIDILARSVTQGKVCAVKLQMRGPDAPASIIICEISVPTGKARTLEGMGYRPMAILMSDEESTILASANLGVPGGYQ